MASLTSRCVTKRTACGPIADRSTPRSLAAATNTSAATGNVTLTMFVSMGALVTVALVEVGGFGELWRRLAAEDAALTTWFGDSRFGFAMFFVGWIAAGFGVVGQPHVMVRYMTIADEEGLSTARWVYLSWFALFSAACVLVGLAARVIVPPSLVSDAEMAFPLVADNLLPGVMVGLMLAGLFAATISTADSQVLCCSAAVSQDLIPSLKSSYRAVKIATLCVTAIALVIALLVTHVPSFNSVFQQVVFAWSALAGSLGPLMVVRVLGRRVDTGLGLAMIAGGFLAVIVWRFVLRFHGDIYDALPGMLAGALVYLIGAPLQRPRAA